jgi:hypothetical protein
MLPGAGFGIEMNGTLGARWERYQKVMARQQNQHCEKGGEAAEREK